MAFLHHRLLLLPQCRRALPSRLFSHMHSSTSLSTPLVLPNSNWKPSFWGSREDEVLGFPRSFASRRFSRVEKSRVVLSEAAYTEEMDVGFTDPNAQPGDQGLQKAMPGSNVVITAGADVGRLALVKSADFIKSSSKASECPGEGFPEIALVGRSNVGKSSLINSLVRRKELAQTSKKPGKTQLINHFLINKKWYLVDLPGYGFAKAPTAIRTDWNDFTKEYFLQRETLVCVLLLVDSSIEPQQIDLDCLDWLGRKRIPLTIVFTKCDRKKKKKNGGRKPEENIKDFLEKLKPLFAETPPWIMTSSETHQGREELLRHIAQLRIFWAS